MKREAKLALGCDKSQACSTFCETYPVEVSLNWPSQSCVHNIPFISFLPFFVSLPKLLFQFFLESPPKYAACFHVFYSESISGKTQPKSDDINSNRKHKNYGKLRIGVGRKGSTLSFDILRGVRIFTIIHT